MTLEPREAAGAGVDFDAALQLEAAAWRTWLFDAALPLWAEHGCNPAGGFFDCLDDDLRPAGEVMRLRVQARQVFVFAQAAKLGWRGPWRAMVRHGLDFLLGVATLEDGVVASRFDLDGSRMEDAPDLYDQGFALLAYASAFELLGDELARSAAFKLMRRLNQRRDAFGGYLELPGFPPTPRANPQMHLLEAVLAWRGLDPDPIWEEAAASLAKLCVTRLINESTGALTEFFNESWRPAPGDLGRLTEPGHHYEWGWLLQQQSAEHARAAGALCWRAETLGVDPGRGVAINAIDTHGSVLDASARMWPQCERLRATLTMRREDPVWAASALQASRALARYTQAGRAGLWRDVMEVDGTLRVQPAPVSSLYHIVSALIELLPLAVRD